MSRALRKSLLAASRSLLAASRLLHRWSDRLAEMGSREDAPKASLGESHPKDAAGIWITLQQSSVPVRATLVGVFVNRLGGFLQPFLVLFLTHRGFSAVQAAVALGIFGAGCFAGVLLGGSFSDWL